MNYYIKLNKMNNLLIALIFSILSYEDFIIYSFNVQLPTSLMKPFLIVYILIILFQINKKNINLTFSLNEVFFFICLILFYIFSLFNLSGGLAYSISMTFLFMSIYLTKYLENINFNKIINLILVFHLPLIIFNIILLFNIDFYTVHSLKKQFFGTHGNPNTLGIWLCFMLIVIHFYNSKGKNLLVFSLVVLSFATLGRGTIIFTIFMLGLIYWQYKYKAIFIIGILVVFTSLYIYNYQPDIVMFIEYRLNEPSNRPYDDMINLLLNNSFLPYGTNVFQDLVKEANISLDNSYFSIFVNFGYLGIFYLFPFIFAFFQSNHIGKIIIFAILFQSFFERILVSNTNQSTILLLFLIIVFSERIGIKNKFNRVT